ncbi:MAG: FAD/NAD(P)-binding protein [Actinomycetota bacterium]|nr:FAD/NAD(P)-binding protein [Actinomycetota bacterium]
MTDVSVAIVGLGSRGLGVLERIVTLAERAGPVRVELIDPTCAGSGVHATDQPDYLLLNTTCSQVSLFPDAASVAGEVGRPGPSLHQWVIGRGLRLADDGFTVGSIGREIRPTDFLPRRVLGEYLEWFLAELLRRAPAHVQVTTHRAAAVDISPGHDGLLVVGLSDGTQTAVGNVFLTTGYTPNTRSPAVAEGLIADPYPLPAQVAGAVGPGQAVAIGGFGLSAMDLMSCLTVGRGGLFVHAGAACSYLPSGREPKLLFFSRSGLPCRARPLVTEFGAPYRPLVFTLDRLDALRRVAGGPLDFDADVLPLVIAEMRVAFRRCQARLAGPVALSALERALASTEDVTEILDGLDARLGPFDAAEAFDGAAGMALAADSSSYQDWLAEAVRLDLAEGVLGFAGSPVKAALDVLRELRDTFRHAVDFGGLTGRSLDDFTARTIPQLNRAVVGPQYERHAELLALLAAGIAQAPFGPAPAITRSSGTWTVTSTRLRQPYSCDVDWVAAAHVELPAVQASASPLIAALHRKGWLRPHRPESRYVHGIDVDPDQHPLDAHGRPRRQVWVLGPLCEGATFYNNLVPSPGGYSRPIFDAHRCVTAMFAGVSRTDKEKAWTTSRS